ncbi:hypothetical protein BGZ89_008715 [Linnemannia elongata]|nr:hypothetical protein BGZ89_008715 [Linnemannia elongata]
MSATAPSKAAKVATTTTIKKKAINNPHRVQVLVDFPDPTVTIKSVHPIAIPGPQRKFVAVADGDKTFHELKDVINDELHRLYAEEAPYGLCGFKNWRHSKIPERYLIRDVLGKQCDVHVTRELLSAKKLGKSTKRKVEGETSSLSSSLSSSSASTVASDPTISSTPAPKAKKAKKVKKDAASPSTETMPKAVVKKEAIATPAIHAPKETAEDKALQAAYADLTEEQIMLNISAAHAQEKKKTASGIATPEASESSASPAPTPAPATSKKQKNTKKVDVVATPTPAPVSAKAAEKEVKKASATIPFPEDSNNKSEEDIMKEISAYHKAQKVMEEMKETVREAEEIKIMMEVSESHVPAAVEGKKEQTKVKKEQVKAKEQAKAKKAAVTPADEESSKPTGASAAAKGKMIVNKGYQSDDSSDFAPVTKGHYMGGARRKDEDVEELQRWAAQDPATLTDEQRKELRLWDKRKYNRDLATAKRRAEINSKSKDPVVAAAATLFLDSLNVRGRPSVASESPRKKIEKYIQETTEKKVNDDEDDDSEEEKSSYSSSSSSTPDAEARVKVEQQPIKEELKPVEREKLPPSMLTEDSDSDEN